MRQFWSDESGATSIEYGLVAIVVSVGIIASIQLFADSLNELWFYVSDTIDNAL